MSSDLVLCVRPNVGKLQGKQWPTHICSYVFSVAANGGLGAILLLQMLRCQLLLFFVLNERVNAFALRGSYRVVPTIVSIRVELKENTTSLEGTVKTKCSFVRFERTCLC